jgi:serine/threonine protein kinase
MSVRKGGYSMIDMHRQLAEALGFEYLETIIDRRGSLLLKVRRDGEDLALKAHDPNTLDTYDRQALLVHEAKVLRMIGPSVGNQYLDSGDHPDYGAWLLIRWLVGAPVGEVASTLRSQPAEEQMAGMIALFKRIVYAYVAIHKAGVLHGDVQPAHLLIEEATDQLLLLDFGLGRLSVGGNPSYRGSLVHYVAPEVAEGVRSGSQDIEYGMPQEVYSIGAMLYLLRTGLTAVDYGTGEMSRIPFADKLTAVANSRLRGFLPTGREVEDALQNVILGCLSEDPSLRPESVSAIARMLEAL